MLLKWNLLPLLEEWTLMVTLELATVSLLTLSEELSQLQAEVVVVLQLDQDQLTEQADIHLH